ncbi:hypothetical protein PFDSM3638_07335 [Pyrococcus furiosus DSM 3638]|uniref:Uncharacterized protein n=3 Tax=Pyrococcus furiosus TaxID=2261 RepID=A0A5C0XTA7_PYRFU|nr:hypothetical protein [Pyrococcus furiosus]AAL81588.1 hypothetical protein PF1464 [Pyrococcus furiosus DSM 3638]AFN04248.1 hypothetical protein PFC_06560 [Pyrococcus furiosus COM1]QEK79094.1 hypothetical protein PFDSM3638_07335 [Pyrococcus furiosus DSM 3638]
MKKTVFLLFIFLMLTPNTLASESIPLKWRVIVTKLNYENGTYVITSDDYEGIVSNLTITSLEDDMYNVTFTLDIETKTLNDWVYRSPKRLLISLTVDGKTNTFICGNEIVFFPFYFIPHNFTIADKIYHMGIPIEFKKSEIIIGDSFENGTRIGVGYVNNLDIYQNMDTFKVKACAFVHVNGTCLKWETKKEDPIFIFRGPYLVQASVIYPKDPFGIFDDPVTIMITPILDNQTLNFLMSLPNPPSTKDNSTLIYAGLTLAFLGIALWRVMKK